jgi:ribosomal protein L37AE/L43A
MQCEICETIKRLGLHPSAHDLWYCSECHTAWAYSARLRFRRLTLRTGVWKHEIRHLLSQVSRHLPRLHVCPAYRQRIIRLGL